MKPVMYLYARGIWLWKQWIVGCETCAYRWTSRRYEEAREAFDTHYKVEHPPWLDSD